MKKEVLKTLAGLVMLLVILGVAGTLEVSTLGVEGEGVPVAEPQGTEAGVGSEARLEGGKQAEDYRTAAEDYRTAAEGVMAAYRDSAWQ